MTTKIEMFKTEQCGRCPQVLELLEDIEADHDVEIEVVDAVEDRKRALAYGVLSVPTVVINEETTLDGVPTRAAIVDAIES